MHKPSMGHFNIRPWGLWVILVFLLPGMRSPQEIALSENININSQILGYNLQYRVYTPPGYGSLADLPVVYITDGQWYIESGEMPQLMDQLIAAGKIEPTIAVFIDNRNPDNLDENRRNRQFFCNRKYADFFKEELIPHIDKTYKTKADRSARVILGLSFGGLNSACFGLQASDNFEGIAMQSPATHPIPDLHEQYRDTPRHTLKIFLSSGSFSDNEQRTRKFKGILEDLGYELHYQEVPFAHNWNNWKPLLDDVLIFYFGS